MQIFDEGKGGPTFYGRRMWMGEGILGYWIAFFSFLPRSADGGGVSSCVKMSHAALVLVARQVGKCQGWRGEREIDFPILELNIFTPSAAATNKRALQNCPPPNTRKRQTSLPVCLNRINPPIFALNPSLLLSLVIKWERSRYTHYPVQGMDYKG